MTRKTTNKSTGNATVSAVQQSHAVSVLSAKNVNSKPNTPKPTTAAAAKPLTPVKTVNAAPVISFAAATAKTSAKVQITPLQPQPVTKAKVNAAPAKLQPQLIAASLAKKNSVKNFDLGVGYEQYMVPNLFAEPANWSSNVCPAHAPHRLVATQNKPSTPKQKSASSHKPLTPQSQKSQQQQQIKSAAPQTKVQHKNVRSASSSLNKTNIKWNTPVGKQLILRPKGGLVLYQPLWLQVARWNMEQMNRQQQRGRSADKYNKAQRIKEAKERAAAQRSRSDFREQNSVPKQQSNATIKAPISHQTSFTNNKAPVSRQTSNISAASTVFHQTSNLKEQPQNKPSTPLSKTKKPVADLQNAWQQPLFASKQQQDSSNNSNNNNNKQKPLQKPQQLRKQHSASSPTGNTPDYFAIYMDRPASPSGFKSQPPKSRSAAASTSNSAAKTPSQQYAALRTAKPKFAPYMDPHAPMPRETISPYAEGSNFVAFNLANEALDCGILMQQPPKQKRVISGKTPQLTKQQSSKSWFTGVAVASAIVAISGVGLSKLYK
ncbi:hypothetical protein HK100_002202 [Physocladia obscura]|uniref:Uncharacterized protein n=1 Tax=Physocladia obscura TaxID=109957 RepID=A0AAD5XLG3_9FUNG|nr:hypothetical protein HK100_002202 [Physocladia obscura]